MSRTLNFFPSVSRSRRLAFSAFPTKLKISILIETRLVSRRFGFVTNFLKLSYSCKLAPFTLQYLVPFIFHVSLSNFQRKSESYRKVSGSKCSYRKVSGLDFKKTVSDSLGFTIRSLLNGVRPISYTPPFHCVISLSY